MENYHSDTLWDLSINDAVVINHGLKKKNMLSNHNKNLVISLPSMTSIFLVYYYGEANSNPPSGMKF